MLTVQEALDILNEARITKSRQVLLRWIREGKLKAETIKGEKYSQGINKKEGYQIEKAELERLIQEKNPHYLRAKALDIELEVFAEKQRVISKIHDLMNDLFASLADPERSKVIRAEIDHLWTVVKNMEE